MSYSTLDSDHCENRMSSSPLSVPPLPNTSSSQASVLDLETPLTAASTSSQSKSLPPADSDDERERILQMPFERLDN